MSNNFVKKFTAAILVSIGASVAHAGPVILAGTDADDHGQSTATANEDGWLFMQRVVENLGPQVTNGNKIVAILGSTSTAAQAANSAFDKSSLVAQGWTRANIGVSQLAGFFAGTGAVSSANAGLILLDSGSANVGGGVDGTTFVPYASNINNFVGGGGGLFSQANGYQWLSALIPTLTVVGTGGSGIDLTAAGISAFPGLTNADLSAGPWHNYFTGFAPLGSFGNSGTNAIIIGAAGQGTPGGGTGGTITNPGGTGTGTGTVPVPASILLIVGGIALMTFRQMRK
jgi:hypothetical protein